MCPILVNGRQLGVARNGVFTAANTDPIPGGRLWPEAALTWNAARAAAIADGVPAGEFMPAGSASSARTFQQQVGLKADWAARGEPQKAAEPGTSNHGWGLAVDVLGPRAQAWLARHGMAYGWSHDEGARVGEVWHYRYVGASLATLARLRNRWAAYTASERRWITEYDRRPGLVRRRVLRRVMTRQRKAIFRAAQRSGWNKANRRARYASLLARTR